MRRSAVVFCACSLLLSVPSSQAAQRGHGTYKLVPDSDGVTNLRIEFKPKHRILYLNRYGGTYSPGGDDSTMNVSSVPEREGTIPPLPLGDAKWQVILECVQDMYSRFAVEVTDVEPAPEVTYIESVVGGVPLDLHLTKEEIWGIAPAAFCGIVEKGINYTFADAIMAVLGQGDEGLQEICATIAQESGHVLGMDHEFLCEDPMTYLMGCGAKTFQDIDSRCGEFEERACKCGTQTQNSVQHLFQVLGAADDVPPEVSVTSPEKGANVKQGFVIEVLATDDIRIDRVELWIGTKKVRVDDEAPYKFNAPNDLAIGAQTLEIRAIDGDENVKTAKLEVTLAEQCKEKADCAEGRTCMDGLCLGDTGADCNVHPDCASRICYVDRLAGLSFCSEKCDPSNDACPTGFSCLEPEFGTATCLPGSLGGGGSGFCAVLGRRPLEVGFTVLAITFAIGFAKRRRRL